ncbi:MAG: toll/interleukin-1 receptor domain-containing protein [Thiolinea sp.]
MPKVFISYSHDSDAHKARVLDLSNRLRKDGIDCWIDQYEPAPPEGWPRKMDQGIREADFVLMVCTAKPTCGGCNWKKRKAKACVAWGGIADLQHAIPGPHPQFQIHPRSV